MVVSDFSGRGVFLDTAPLIYFIEGHSRYQSLLMHLFSSAEKGDFSFVTSTVTLLEVLVKPLQEGRADLASQYKDILTSAAGMVILDVTTPIAERAALLRARYSLKTPDAIQLAAAIEAKADYFLTNDIRLKNISEISVVCLGEIHM